MVYSKQISVVALLFVLTHLAATLKVSKLTLYTVDKNELDRIKANNESNVRQGLKPITYSPLFMRLAQIEAERFAAQSSLAVPKIKTSKSYVAYLLKITGQIDDEWIGVKSFYTNLKNMKKINIVDISEPLKDYTDFVDEKKFYSVGYGRSVDRKGDIYLVRLLLTGQKKTDDLEEIGDEQVSSVQEQDESDESDDQNDDDDVFD